MSRMTAARGAQQDQNRLAGRGLVWVDHGFSSGLSRPTAASNAGTSLQGADVAHLYVNLRADASVRELVITITVDTSATYTVSLISGTDLSYAASGGDDAAAIATGLKAAIDGNATAASLVSATVDGSTLVLRSNAMHGGDFFLHKLEATGSGALAATGDRPSCLFQIWMLPDGVDAPQEWVYPVITGTSYQTSYIEFLAGASTKLEVGKGPFVVNGAEGLVYPLSVTGYSRIFVQAAGIKGPTVADLEAGDEPNVTYTDPSVKIGLALGD